MEFVGLTLLIVLAVVLLPFVATVLLTVGWVWMLVDAILREPWEYPGGSQNEKWLWIILMIVLQISAAVYFFTVFRKIQRGTVAAPAQNAPYATLPAATPTPPASA